MIKKMKKHDKHKFKDLLLEGYNYNKWFDIEDHEELHDEEESVEPIIKR